MVFQVEWHKRAMVKNIRKQENILKKYCENITLILKNQVQNTEFSLKQQESLCEKQQNNSRVIPYQIIKAMAPTIYH